MNIMCPCQERSKESLTNAAVNAQEEVGGRVSQVEVTSHSKRGKSVSAVDVTMDARPSFDVSKALDCALSLGSTHALLKQPWEHNIVMRDVLGNSVDLLRPPPSSNQESQAGSIASS